MKYELKNTNGEINRGSLAKIRECMDKAKEGKPITVAFLGGSITQGSLSSSPETCYAYRTYDWWVKTFPLSKVTYLNTGIGGTSSQFGVARVEKQVLDKNPDFLLVEFAVNDENNLFFEETYEGLIRRILKDRNAPAVLLMNNVRYDNCSSAEEMHLRVAKHYHLPMVSMKSTILPEVKEGRIPNREITPDDLHPNDEGHSLVASVITNYLQRIYEGLPDEEGKHSCYGKDMPKPLSDNGFENSVRLQNINSDPILCGFEKDNAKKTDFLDLYKEGWTASNQGDKIIFETECTGVAVQFRKSVKRPTPIAMVTIDEMVSSKKMLNGNFDEEWGDCLFIETICKQLPLKKHKIEIEIIETHEQDIVPFYLVSVIASK